MKRLLSVLTIAVATLVIGASSAHAADGEMSVWFTKDGQPTSTASGDKCTARFKVYQQEYGQSGVNKFRAKFELRGLYDPGLAGLSYASTGWLKTNEFPDDHQNYWYIWSQGFNFKTGKQYQIRAVMIGERPSLWQKDIKRVYKIGDVGCDPYGALTSASA